ncbi:MAG: 3-methyl-2-oxobutanoate hydroxymethyltransferase [Chloroflexota bacterium]|nr:3-methyl-2-oxobutanoate hydroxymethyltransferase [Chloroflexota bacterium]
MTSQAPEHSPARTIPELRRYKAGGDQLPLVMVTAYDAPTARFVVEAGVDIILVGDSVGTTLLGYDSTVPVTLDDILHHTKAVRRGAPGAHIVADLPFMTYQVSDEQAVANAGRLLKEGGADAVKLEGGLALASRVEAIARAGIPVVGHIGLTPQTAGLLGGFKVQGQEFVSARALIDDAIAIARAGAYMLVIEVVPSALAKMVTERVPIPVIGIGAGADCDGQVLVIHDLLGIEDRHAARFVKRYASLASDIRNAVTAFAGDVREGAYPQPEHTYKMKSTVLAELRDSLEREPS